MISPAKRHFQRVRAAQEAEKAAATGIRPDASLYELMLAQVYEHSLQLKGIQSVESKGRKKAELLPEYDAYIQGVLESNSGIQDDVLMTVLIWRIDAGDYAGALELAEYAIEHGLTPPDKFQRSTATIIAEEIAEAALKHEMALDLLQKAGELLLGEDMPDQVTGKLNKALGMHNELQATEPKSALNYLQTADNLLKKSGVKTAIKTLQKQLDNQTQPPE